MASYVSKRELEHYNHERRVLKLAFLIQTRNESWAAQFLLHLARRRPSEMKIMKISPPVILGRPGGMSRGVGRRYEESSEICKFDLRSLTLVFLEIFTKPNS